MITTSVNKESAHAVADDDWFIRLREERAPPSRQAEMLFLGDVAFTRRVAKLMNKHGVSFPFAALPADYFRADAVVFNLECCLTHRGQPWEPKPELMRGQQQYLDAFPSNGQAFVANVANNHFLDHGEIGALDTLAALEQRNMRYIGATGSAVKEQPSLLETAAGTVALLAFAPAGHRLPDSSPANVAVSPSAKMAQAVRAAKQHADVVVVSLHHGVEYCRYVAPASRKLAHSLVDAGADAVICHHAHVAQAVERVGHAVIFHGIGNFLLDAPVDRIPATANTLAPRIRISEGKIEQVQIDALALNSQWQPTLLTAERKAQVRRDVERFSALLASPVGRVWNDWQAKWALLEERIKTVGDMTQREGIAKTAVYYRRRVQERLSLR